MLVISISSTELTVEEALILANPKIAGIVLFTKNYQNKQQLKLLTKSIHAINPNILIFVDQEGGTVQRFKHEFTILPKAIEYGQVYDGCGKQAALNMTYKNGYIMARELLDCGVDISLAPVLDSHNSNSKAIGRYERAFHINNANIIAELTVSFARGMREAGMRTCGKHFPDHGQCEVDSHLAMPTDSRTKTELLNYIKCVYGGLIKENLLDFVMPAHVMYPKLDAKYPATYSNIILQDILRTELNFTGTIISDCLAMGAMANSNTSLTERVNLALHAGQDLTIICHQPIAVIKHLLGIENNSVATVFNTSVNVS
jgi:beta-N-acetylhexosaminidase